MRPKSLILLSLALGCGLVAALGINQMMAKQKSGSSGSEMVDIVVAVKDVNINDPVQADWLKIEAWPVEKVLPGAASKIEDVEGRRTRSRIYAGEQILDAKLLGKGIKGESTTDHIPTGFRVVSVKVDAVSATGNLIKPGDRVDALIHIPQGTRGVTEPTTKTFLQDIRVFAINDTITRDVDGQAKVTAQTISLLVKPDDVELVTLASTMGQIRFSMRGPSDEEKTSTDGADIRELLTGRSSALARSDESVSPVEPLAPNPLEALLKQANAGSQGTGGTPELNRPGHRMRIIRGAEIEDVEVGQSDRTSPDKPGEAAAAKQPLLSIPGAFGFGAPGASPTK